MSRVETDPGIDFASTSEGRQSAQPSIALLGITRLLWERRALFRRVTIWIFAISTVVALLISSRYESTLTLMPPDSLNDNGMMLAALAGKVAAAPGLAGMAGSLLGGKSTGALFVELLESRTVQVRIVERFNLQKVYRDRYEEDARNQLNARTSVTEDRKSGVISLGVTDTSPQRAHDLAQAYVEELDRLVSQVSTSSARRERVFIEQRLNAVKSDLEVAEKQFGAFASKNTALNIQEQAKAMVESAAMLQGQMIAAQSELEGLQQIYTTNNIRVRAAQARIDELKRQLGKLGGSDSSLLPDAAPSGEMYPSIRRLPLLGVEWADLYRRMKIQETVFELLNQQYELARIQEAKEIPTVNVIDQPNVPQKKSYPPRLVIVVLSTMTALLLAVVWVIGMFRWDKVPPQDPKKAIVTSIRDKGLASAIGVAHRLHLARVAARIARYRSHAADTTF